MSDEKRMLTPQEAARRLGVSVQTIRYLIHTGQLPADDVARAGSKQPRYLIDECDLDDLEYLEYCRSAPAALAAELAVLTIS